MMPTVSVSKRSCHLFFLALWTSFCCWTNRFCTDAFVVSPRLQPLQPLQPLLPLMSPLRPRFNNDEAPVEGTTRHPLYDNRRESYSLLRLYMARKAKRGKLASNVNLDATSSIKQQSRPKAKPSAAKTGSDKPKREALARSSGMSPLLAEWVAKTTSESPSPSSTKKKANAADDDDNEKDDSDYAMASSPLAAKFESFGFEGSSTNSKRSISSAASTKKQNKKKSPRVEAQEERDNRAVELVAEFLELLESPKDSNKNTAKNSDSYLDTLLQPIQQLVSLPLTTEQGRTLLAGSARNDYRLAWIGSDEAMSAIGTGLHKVPLARLQEVFLSLPGRQRMELLEVIRVLGPFPNVKNVLQGKSTQSKVSRKNNNNDDNDDNSDNIVEWKITWDSMLDGTGKELLAGKAENVRTVLLHAYFCTKEALVATVSLPTDDAVQPPTTTTIQELVQGKGRQNLLVFVQEDNLDLKLEQYRVGNL
ncbi:hypothetical protein ACA910_022726 [Epithemia clementina (nom. ined.)]